MMSKQTSNTVYISRAWQQHEELIEHLTKFSQNILLIIAPQAGGKTTFLQHFIGKSTPALLKKCFKAQAFAHQEALLKEVVKSFGLPWQGSSQVKSQLKHVLEDAIVQNQAWLLFIDDAHLLSDEQLQTLIEISHFEEHETNQLHLVLLGEPSLELRLFSPEFASSANGKIYTVELESWTQQDIKTFLANQHIQLSHDQLVALFESSAGLPGQVLNQIKTEGQEKNVENHNMEKLKRRSFHPVSLGILAGVLIGGSYLLLNNNTQEEGPNIPINAAQMSENTWAKKEISPQKNSPSVVFHFDKVDTTDVIEDEDQDTNVNNLPGDSSKNVNPDLELQDAAMTQEKAKTASLVTPKTATLETLKAATLETPKAATLETPKAAALPAPSQTSNTDKKMSLSNKTTTQAAKLHKKVKEKNTKTLNSEEQYLLTMNKNHYTLQLLGASKEASVKQFIQKYSLANKSYSFKTKRQGKDWYVVVYGDYPSLKAAKTAALHDAKLQQANIQPWVREVGSIQKDMKQS